MTPDQAIATRVRLDTAIMALQEAMHTARDAETGRPLGCCAAISWALRYAQQALAACEGAQT